MSLPEFWKPTKPLGSIVPWIKHPISLPKGPLNPTSWEKFSPTETQQGHFGGLPFHHLKRFPKKELEKPGTSPRDNNTCQFLGLIFFSHVTFGDSGGPLHQTTKIFQHNSSESTLTTTVREKPLDSPSFHAYKITGL